MIISYYHKKCPEYGEGTGSEQDRIDKLEQNMTSVLLSLGDQESHLFLVFMLCITQLACHVGHVLLAHGCMPLG